MPPHPLTNFEIQKYYKNEPRFNGVFSRNNLPKKIKDGAYIMNMNMQILGLIDEYANVATHWIALFCKKMKFFISIVLVLNIFPTKLKNLLKNSLKNSLKNFLEIKIQKLTFFEYKKTSQCVDTFA